MSAEKILLGLQITESLMSVAIESMRAAQHFQRIVGRAQAEGRDLTDEELSEFDAEADLAEKQLQDAIARAKER